MSSRLILLQTKWSRGTLESESEQIRRRWLTISQLGHRFPAFTSLTNWWPHSSIQQHVHYYNFKNQDFFYMRKSSSNADESISQFPNYRLRFEQREDHWIFFNICTLREWLRALQDCKGSETILELCVYS